MIDQFPNESEVVAPIMVLLPLSKSVMTAFAAEVPCMVGVTVENMPEDIMTGEQDKVTTGLPITELPFMMPSQQLTMVPEPKL